MKKLGCLVIFVVIGFAAWLTNPSKQQHVDNAYSVLRAQGVENFGIDPSYLAIGEGLLGKEGMDSMLGSFVKRRDYYFFSLTQVNILGRSHYVSLGLFGRMWNIF